MRILFVCSANICRSALVSSSLISGSFTPPLVLLYSSFGVSEKLQYIHGVDIDTVGCRRCMFLLNFWLLLADFGTKLPQLKIFVLPLYRITDTRYEEREFLPVVC